jgi:hypothetical protein
MVRQVTLHSSDNLISLNAAGQVIIKSWGKQSTERTALARKLVVENDI